MHGCNTEGTKYSCYLYGDEAQTIVQSHDYTASPLFMYLPMHDTHAPYEARALGFADVSIFPRRDERARVQQHLSVGFSSRGYYQPQLGADVHLATL